MKETMVEFRNPDWGNYLTKFSQECIGRKPEIRIDSPNRVVAVFNPALTHTEKNILNNDLPVWLKWYFVIELTDNDET